MRFNEVPVAKAKAKVTSETELKYISDIISVHRSESDPDPGRPVLS